MSVPATAFISLTLIVFTSQETPRIYPLYLLLISLALSQMDEAVHWVLVSVNLSK